MPNCLVDAVQRMYRSGRRGVRGAPRVAVGRGHPCRAHRGRAVRLPQAHPGRAGTGRLGGSAAGVALLPASRTDRPGALAGAPHVRGHPRRRPGRAPRGGGPALARHGVDAGHVGGSGPRTGVPARHAAPGGCELGPARCTAASSGRARPAGWQESGAGRWSSLYWRRSSPPSSSSGRPSPRTTVRRESIASGAGRVTSPSSGSTWSTAAPGVSPARDVRTRTSAAVRLRPADRPAATHPEAPPQLVRRTRRGRGHGRELAPSVRDTC